MLVPPNHDGQLAVLEDLVPSNRLALTDSFEVKTLMNLHQKNGGWADHGKRKKLGFPLNSETWYVPCSFLALCSIADIITGCSRYDIPAKSPDSTPTARPWVPNNLTFADLSRNKSC